MHKTNIIHRDVKPENFMFDENMNLCIIDFGLSCSHDSSKNMKKPIGTPRYSSFNTHLDIYVYEKKDDFISIFYVFMELFGDCLPWGNLCIKKENYRNILYYHMKKDTDYIEFYKNNTFVRNIIKSYYYFLENDEVRFYS